MAHTYKNEYILKTLILFINQGGNQKEVATGSKDRPFLFFKKFLKTFYFVLGYSWLTMLW